MNNNNNITLRPSTLDDAEQISKCITLVAREEKYLDTTTGFTVDETRAFFTSLQQRGGIQVVATVPHHSSDTIIGWCDVSPCVSEGTRHTGILRMGIQKEYRGQGLGRRLLQDVLQRVFIEHHNMTRVELQVFASNHVAIQLYQSAGFVVEGRKRRARILNGVVDDDIIMGLLREEYLTALQAKQN